MLWHNNIPPVGWLVCDGRTAPRADYLALYNLITVNGTVFPYGANITDAQGVVRFYLPNMTDRFALSSAPGTSVGTTTGSDTHTHTFTASLSSVNSNSVGHAHNFSPGGLASGGGHAHNANVYLDSDTSTAANTAETNSARGKAGDISAAFMGHAHSASGATNTDGAHGHSISGGTGFTNTDNHAHGVSFAFGSYVPSGSNIPANQRFYFIVLGAV